VDPVSLQFAYDEVYYAGAAPVAERAQPPDFAALALGKTAAHRTARERLQERYSRGMRTYREFRLDTMFLEYRPLDEQLELLKQRLKEPDPEPPSGQ
jgi:hypothetical protein